MLTDILELLHKNCTLCPESGTPRSCSVRQIQRRTRRTGRVLLTPFQTALSWGTRWWSRDIPEVDAVSRAKRSRRDDANNQIEAEAGSESS